MAIGRTIGGRYRLEERLGRGGGGEVWLATDLKLPRQVALKRAPHGGAHALEQVQQEANTLALVSHPNVVTVHDTVQDVDPLTSEDELWIVMEYLRGRTLADLSPISVEDAARYGARLAGGLQTIHDAGLLHRDITPANVIITDGGVAKLIDFGVTQSLGALETLEGDAGLIGTPGFIAPEVAEANELTSAADVFGLGATLYYALHATSPYGDGDPQQVLERARTQMANPPTRAGQITPLLTKMLRLSAGGRPSLERVRAELAMHGDDPDAGLGGVVRDLGPGTSGDAVGTAATAESGEEPAKHSPRRRRLILGACVVAAVVAATAVAVAAIGDGDPAPGRSAPTSPAAADAGAVGDESGADPCALLDLDSFTSFGTANLDTDVGVPNGCNVDISGTDGSGTTVELKMWRSRGDLNGTSEERGVVTVVESTEGMPDECVRELILPDGDHIISVDAEGTQGDPEDTCDIADAAVDHAAENLNEGEIPRRVLEPDPRSVQRLRTCDLATPATVEAAVGGEPSERTVGFAGWDCSWEGPEEAELRVLFTRDRPPGSDDGRQIKLSGHKAYVAGDSWGEGTCLVDIVNIEHEDTDDAPLRTAELVRVLIDDAGAASQVDRCNRATSAATVIAAELP